MSDIQSIFNNFIGSYNLERKITNLKTEETYLAIGNAEFSKTEEENILQYNESGTVNLKGKEYKFYRKYKVNH